jgi:hypothetical protein
MTPSEALLALYAFKTRQWNLSQWESDFTEDTFKEIFATCVVSDKEAQKIREIARKLKIELPKLVGADLRAEGDRRDSSGPNVSPGSGGPLVRRPITGVVSDGLSEPPADRKKKNRKPRASSHRWVRLEVSLQMRAAHANAAWCQWTRGRLLALGSDGPVGYTPRRVAVKRSEP